MKKSLLWAGILLCVTSCMKDRTFNIALSDADKQVTVGTVLINEICASGSTYTNEFGGSSPDWLEIYNPNFDTLKLEKDRWYVTDETTFPYKFALPEIKIPPRKFFIICCDSNDSIAQQVHTNFSLSSNGETVAVFYKTEAGPFLQIDVHSYNSAVSGVSIGRIPDGSTNWANCSLMTPGTSNQ